MKTRFGKDVDGPFVEVTFTLRDQDDSPEFNFYSLSPDDRTKLCEHLPRKVNGLRARCDHSEAEPAGHRVAALLVDLEKLASEEHARSERLIYPDGEIHDGARDAYREAARLITAHLTAPSPLDLAAAEVCAADVAEVADTFDAWAALGDICRAEADGLAEERAQFAKAGRVALAGMLACDGSGPVCPECRQARHLCMHEPAGHRVAALLRAVEDAADAEHKRGELYLSGDPVGDAHDAARDAYREAARLITEHLAVPSPLDLAVAEVVASPLSEHAAIEINGADDAIEVIGELHAEREADTDRSLLLSVARVALAGMLACDAADRGKGPPRDPYGHLDPCAACGERPAMICDLCSICEEQQHQTGGKWDGETLARMKAERAAKGGSK